MTRRGPGRPPYPDILTPAEWRILDEVRTGATNAEIAIRLGISPYTVKYHVSNILGKLELRNRRQIATWSPQPERVRFGEMVGARLRALVAPLAAPLRLPLEAPRRVGRRCRCHARGHPRRRPRHPPHPPRRARERAHLPRPGWLPRRRRDRHPGADPHRLPHSRPHATGHPNPGPPADSHP